jgi:hypothetical protein
LAVVVVVAVVDTVAVVVVPVAAQPSLRVADVARGLRSVASECLPTLPPPGLFPI